MSLSTAWVYFVVFTAAIVAFVLIFASMSSKGPQRSRERADREAREAGRTPEVASEPRPQDASRVAGHSFASGDDV